MAFSSKRSFFMFGMKSITLTEPLDCTICQEPLLFTPTRGADSTMGDLSAPSNPHDSRAATTAGNGEDSPEPAVRISPCNHVFGANCIRHWLETSNSPTCPMCRQELYPKRKNRQYIMRLAPPMREQRLAFARYMEHATARPELAPVIRRNLMGRWVRSLMIHVLVLVLEWEGYEVGLQWSGDETMYDDESGESGDLTDTSTDFSAFNEWYRHSRVR